MGRNIAASRTGRPLASGYQIGQRVPLTTTPIPIIPPHSIHSLTHSDKEILLQHIVSAIEGFVTRDGQPRNRTEAIWFLGYATSYFYMVTINLSVTAPPYTRNVCAIYAGCNGVAVQGNLPAWRPQLLPLLEYGVTLRQVAPTCTDEGCSRSLGDANEDDDDERGGGQAEPDGEAPCSSSSSSPSSSSSSSSYSSSSSASSSSTVMSASCGAPVWLVEFKAHSASPLKVSGNNLFT
jgi:hypothetical protein